MFEGMPKPENEQELKKAREARLIELDSRIKMAERTISTELKGSERHALARRQLLQLTDEREKILSGSLENLDEEDVEDVLNVLNNPAA